MSGARQLITLSICISLFAGCSGGGNNEGEGGTPGVTTVTTTNHYIRAGATGTESGNDWTNACTSFSGSCTFVRGDIYYVADGSYGSQTFSTEKAGTTLITVKKATVADHGTSTGWLDTFGDGVADWANGWIFTNNTGYYLLTGVSRTSATSGHGFLVGSASVCNEQIINIGVSGADPSDHLTFEYIELRGPGYGANDSCNSCGLYNNATNGTTNNITVRYSYSTGMFVPLLTNRASDFLVEYNYFDGSQSSPSTHGEVWSLDSTDNVIFRWNFVHNPEGTAAIAVINGGTGPFVAPTNANTASNWEIYGNVFEQRNYSVAPGHNPGVGGIIWCINDTRNRNFCDKWKFFNNTISGFSMGTTAARLQFDSVSGVTQTIARNNIWDSNSNGAPHTNVTLSHNWYRNTSHTAESNEQAGSSNPFVSSSTGDYHLSGATNAASLTSDPSGNTVDMDGVARSTPDRGAFEF